MTDKEIIKALECCVNKFDGWVRYNDGNQIHKVTIADILDVINHQQAEIERLNSPVLIIDNVDLSENEIAEKLRNLPVQIFPDNEEQIRNEAIKEFAERLKAETKGLLGANFVDNLVKEMVGDTE